MDSLTPSLHPKFVEETLGDPNSYDLKSKLRLEPLLGRRPFSVFTPVLGTWYTGRRGRHRRVGRTLLPHVGLSATVVPHALRGECRTTRALSSLPSGGRRTLVSRTCGAGTHGKVPSGVRGPRP